MSTTNDTLPCGRLKLLRKRVGKSQAEMAELVGVSTTGYQNYERGRRDIPADVASRANAQFNVSLDWLYEGRGRMFGPVPFGEFDLATRVAPEGRLPESEDEEARSQYAARLVKRALADAGITVGQSFEDAMRDLVLWHGAAEGALPVIARALRDELKARGVNAQP